MFLILVILILLLLTPIVLPVVIICVLHNRNVKEVKKAKEEEAKAQNNITVPYEYKKLDSVGIKREYYRVLFNEFIYSNFKGVSWWECPGEDVALHFNGLHMTRLHFFDGTTQLLSISVEKEERKTSAGGEKWNIHLIKEEKAEETEEPMEVPKDGTQEDVPANTAEEISSDNREEENLIETSEKTDDDICEDWLDQNKAELDKAYKEKYMLTYTIEDFPAGKDIIDMILNKLSSMGKFDSEYSESEIILVPVVE
ncbi:MAG: hypothetical protein UHN47_03825 [Lachnospiraceae bacterium]|nr:hypothetical protein [Lachnospiraceae bacterium]